MTLPEGRHMSVVGDTAARADAHLKTFIMLG